MGDSQADELLAPLYALAENQAVQIRLADMALLRAKAAGRKIGICGQAHSDYPDSAKFLVEEGIDSISLNPDSVLKTTTAILEAEEALDSGLATAVAVDAGRQEAGAS